MVDQTPPAEALHQVMEVMTQIREACSGYRAQLIEDEYSPTAAEKMTMDLHAQLVLTAFGRK